MRKTIYIADDAQNIRELLRDFLADAYEVEVFETGDALWARFAAAPADLVILDIMMPGTDGFTLCAKIRSISDVPIILLSAKDMDADFVTGFTMGCDDYFTKPFSPIKLAMRVKAVFRRAEKQAQKKGQEKTLSFGDIRLHIAQKLAYCGEKILQLTNTEYAFLLLLFENQERAVSRAELLDSVWGYEEAVETRATDDTVKRLRKKLAACSSRVLIQTVWGYGFRLAEESAP